MKTLTKSVKHTFTQPEIAELNVEFGQSFDALQSAEAQLKSIKAQYTAKVEEAEARMSSLRSTINAGFEHRDEKCFVVLVAKESKKYYFLERTVDEDFTKKHGDPMKWPRELAVLVEPMTNDDFQQELVDAEGKFEKLEEIKIFPPIDKDKGILVVGRLNGKWFSALRVNIGNRKIEERLDSEQPCSKKRNVQVERSLNRFYEWVSEALGREEAKGFKNQLELVKAEHAEREE